MSEINEMQDFLKQKGIKLCLRCRVVKPLNSFEDDKKYCIPCLEKQRKYIDIYKVKFPCSHCKNKYKCHICWPQANNEMFNCEICNKSMFIFSKNKHLRTKLHLDALAKSLE